MPTVVTNSACSDKQAHLAHRLHEAVPQGAKLALCFDPEGALDGCETIVDTAGRAWRMLTYQEDDLAFRLAIRELEAAGWNADAPILLRVAMPAFVPLTYLIELSFLDDVLQRVEGEPIDLRTDAVVTCHTEPVVWPESLQTHAARISRDLAGFVEGYWRLRRAIGRDRPLGRHHVAAVLLLAKSRDLQYRDLELPHAYPAELIARFLTLAATHRLDTEDERLLWDVLTATGHVLDYEPVRPWMGFPIGESLVLVALTEFLERHGVQNAALALSGLGLFSRPVQDLMPLLGQVCVHVKEQAQHWQHLIQRADREYTQEQAERAVSLLKSVRPPAQWLTLMRHDTPGMIALALLLGYLDDQLTQSADPTFAAPAQLPTWAEAWMSGWEVPHHDAPAEARAATLFRMLSRIATLQRRLAEPVPQANEIGTLVDAYVEDGDVHLELALAFARKEADVVGDEMRLERLRGFFDRLQQWLLARLQALDTRAGALIRANVQGYLQHQRSTIHFLQPLARRTQHRGRRLFVWLFDGMRYDT
jgi:hypothetical protein